MSVAPLFLFYGLFFALLTRFLFWGAHNLRFGGGFFHLGRDFERGKVNEGVPTKGV